MTQKLTLHVRDADEAVVDRFKEAGGNLSQLLAQAVGAWQRREEKVGDFETITLKMDEPPDKQFIGRWLWTEYNKDGDTMLAGVAQTRGDKFVSYRWDEYQEATHFQIADELEHIEDPEIQAKAIAMTSDGIEFLDI